MPKHSLQDKNVRELQGLALSAPGHSEKRPRKRLSRAACLHLIDLLSRWSGSGLAIIAGASIFLAITAGRAAPARATAWSIMLIGALWACRRLRSEFRSGGNVSARPFRWRASYTSCLSVLGVVFACAPILLSPADTSTAILLQISGLTLIAGLSAALAHSAHFASAGALIGPISAFAVLSGLRAGSAMLVAAGIAASIASLILIYAASRLIAAGAAQKYPRTSLLRREIGQRHEIAAASERPARTATPA